MSSLSDQVEIALLIERVKQAETHMKTQDERIDALVKERTDALKYGVVTLGTGIIALIAFIVSLFKDGRISP